MAFDPEHAVPVVGLQVGRGRAVPPKSAAELGAERAAAESSTGERFLAGVGHGFVNLGRGLQQGALWAADGMHLDGANRARQALQKDIDNAQGIDQALLSTPAGRVGDFVGTTAATALIPGANTYRGTMLAGGVLGALEPTATGESRLENTIAGAANGAAGKAIGDAAGQGVKYVLGRVAAARDAAREAENAARQIKDRPPPTAPGPPQGPPPSTNSTVPIAPPPAGRVVSGGGNHAPELTEEERRVAAEAAGVQPHEVPPETAEVAHLVHSDPESALRIHAEHPENTDAFVAAVRERNRSNAEKTGASLDPISSPRSNDPAKQVRSPLATEPGRPVDSASDEPAYIGPVQFGQITTLEDAENRRVLGDTLQAHELWQHANLKAHGLVTRRRLSTLASRKNPVIILDDVTHGKVSAAQRAFDGKNQHPVENINSNAAILRDLKVAPEEQINLLHRRALLHAKSHGFK